MPTPLPTAPTRNDEPAVFVSRMDAFLPAMKTFSDELNAPPLTSISAAYTFVLLDAGKRFLHPSADITNRIWTIPANASVAFPIGTEITFINQNMAGIITIAITTDTMRLSPGGTIGSRSLAANGIATAIKLAADQWIISGTGLT